ncbi:MAG: hypothetical protein V4671_12065 [Armatimonadota bacterium]
MRWPSTVGGNTDNPEPKSADPDGQWVGAIPWLILPTGLWLAFVVMATTAFTRSMDLSLAVCLGLVVGSVAFVVAMNLFGTVGTLEELNIHCVLFLLVFGLLLYPLFSKARMVREQKEKRAAAAKTTKQQQNPIPSMTVSSRN